MSNFLGDRHNVEAANGPEEYQAGDVCPREDRPALLPTSAALGLAGLGEFALQKHSGNTKALLLVDRLSQDVVVGNRLEAGAGKQLGQEL